VVVPTGKHGGAEIILKIETEIKYLNYGTAFSAVSFLVYAINYHSILQYKRAILFWIALIFSLIVKVTYLFVSGAIRSLRANKITITKANAITTSPGTPYSSAKPVPANAVVVGIAVNFEARAA
jgi:hypothetical protein